MSGVRVAVDVLGARQLVGEYELASAAIGAAALELAGMVREAADLLNDSTSNVSANLEILATDLTGDQRDLDWRIDLIEQHDASSQSRQLAILLADTLSSRAEVQAALAMIGYGVDAGIAIEAAKQGLDPEAVAVALANNIDYETAYALVKFSELDRLTTQFEGAHPFVQEQIDKQRRALIEELAGSDDFTLVRAVLSGLNDGESAAESFASAGQRLEDLAYEVKINQVAAEHGISVAEAELRLVEMEAAMQRLVTEGFDPEDAAVTVNASFANGYDLDEIERVALLDGSTLRDAANLMAVASAFAMSVDEYRALVDFKEHFETIDNATGGDTDGTVSDGDLRYVIDNPGSFDAAVVATAHAVLDHDDLRHRIDTARDNNEVLTDDGSFGDHERDDGEYSLDDLSLFEVKQQINFLVGAHMDDIDVASEGGTADGFKSKADYQAFLDVNGGQLTEEERWAIETVIAGEWYDKGWLERNKKAIALTAAVIAGAAIVIGTGGLGSGVSGMLITGAVTFAAGTATAGATTLAINGISDESDWDDDVLSNSFQGGFAGLGGGGLGAGLKAFGGMTLAGKGVVALGLTSDVTGLAGMGTFDYALEQTGLDLDETHSTLNRVSLATGVVTIGTAGAFKLSGVAMVDNALPPGAVDPSSLKPYELKVYNELMDRMDLAATAKLEIDELAERIAANYDGAVASAPLKSETRALEKAIVNYDGDVSRINDLARNTIVVDADQLDNVVAELRDAGADVWVVRHAQDPMGYSGVNSNVRTNGIGAEIQVNTPEMIFAKEGEANARAILGDAVYEGMVDRFGDVGGRGHDLYELWRILSRESPEAVRLAEESKAYYEQFQPR